MNLLKPNLNFFLRTRSEIDQCTQFLKENGLMEHGLSCKNFDMAYILPHIGDGNILDMGSCGSFVLYNTVKKGCVGEKHGIDLMYPEDYVLTWPPEHTVVTEGVSCIKGDLMNPPYEDGKFQYITCLSVMEHEVDLSKLAEHCSRLLSAGGKLFLTFDYWDPKIDTTGKELYGLKWNILSRQEVEAMISIFQSKGLQITGEIDWATDEAVINPAFCSPFDVAYTFGVFEFEKK